ncbi:hypothetical protein BD779DRAFT_1560379 [Infundibulicybe gibba]|nr:hypothetical protein BD779DRAFT_1560379 [Infundibulicybe gibba]
MLKSPLSAPPSGDSSLSSSVATPPTETLTLAAPLARRPRSLRTHPSNSSLASVRRHTLTLRTTHAPLPDLDTERSYGELDAYPLKRSSMLCKASGGGRWEPKQSPVLAGYRVPVPGGKAPFELEMERQEQEERARRENPVVRDGEFQYRFPRDPEPIIIARSPLHLSTF